VNDAQGLGGVGDVYLERMQAFPWLSLMPFVQQIEGMTAIWDIY
jgi:hypothetical protein